jgi:hypothetical protein
MEQNPKHHNRNFTQNAKSPSFPSNKKLKIMKVNADKRTQLIKSTAQACFDQIKSNCENGQAITELCMDAEIASEAKKQLEALLLADNTYFTFMIVKSNPNPYTGRIEHFRADTCDGERTYKIKIL